MDFNTLAGLGVGGLVAALLIKLVIPLLITTFRDELSKERTLFRDEMSLERSMHLTAIRMQADEIKGLASALRERAQDGRSPISR